MDPLVPFVAVRSSTAGPRTPRWPLWIFAIVAGDFRPSKVPLTVSFRPARTALTDPEPAIVAIIAVSMGTGDSLVRKLRAACPSATADPASHAPIASDTTNRVIMGPRLR